MKVEAVVQRKQQLTTPRAPGLLFWVMLGLAVLAVAVSPRLAGAQTRDLFNNFNSAPVATGPNLPPLFPLASSAQVTELVTYHWNNGWGAPPGTISLRSSYGQIFGPFPARGEAGPGGATVNWVATANVTVPAGYYTVLDSDPNTRSYNQQSGNRHFAIVRGSFVNTAPSTSTSMSMPTATTGSRPAGPQSSDLFNNFNNDAVRTGTYLPPLFPLASWAQITELVTYHWNSGQGAAPGTISLRSSYGQIFGPFPARGESGPNGRPNIVWIAAANVTVPAGYYTVLDSDPNTRSYNDRTTGHGFAIVRGSLVSPPKSTTPWLPKAPVTTTTTPIPAPCPLYPNGDCRGPSCVHPDLIAYGGNGPCGSSVARSVHIPYTLRSMGGDTLYVAALVPGQTVAKLAHDCAFSTAFPTKLVLLDDEPYYYYYTRDQRRGNGPAVALFGCQRY